MSPNWFLKDSQKTIQALFKLQHIFLSKENFLLSSYLYDTCRYSSISKNQNKYYRKMFFFCNSDFHERGSSKSFVFRFKHNICIKYSGFLFIKDNIFMLFIRIFMYFLISYEWNKRAPGVFYVLNKL